MPSRVVDFCTPLQVLTEHVSVISTNTLTPRVFGCVAYVHIQKIHRTKLDPCALRCVFVGFASHHKGDKCYHPATRHMYITMDVTFSESEYLYTPISPPFDHQGESSNCDLNGVLEWLDVQKEKSLGGVHGVPSDADAKPAVVSKQQALTEPTPSIPQRLTEKETASPCIGAAEGECIGDQQGITKAPPSLSSSTVPSSNASSLDIPEVSTSDTHVTNDIISSYKLPPRQNRGVPLDRFYPEGKVKYPLANYVSYKNLSSEHQAWVNNVDSIQVPTRVEDALKSREWTEAMDEEMRALQKNNTWEVLELPKGKKLVGCLMRKLT
ncbi:hypothetical protein ACFX11_023034 [Malus domestica]